VLGGATMVYPFLLMISGSTKSAMDVVDLDVWPRFTRDDSMLYRRYAEGLFNERIEALRMAYNVEAATFRQVELPNDINRELVAEWEVFLSLDRLPTHADMLGFVESPSSRTVLKQLREFKRAQMRLSSGDVEAYNDATGTRFDSWNAFFVLAESYHSRLRGPVTGAFYQAFVAHKRQQPASQRVVVSLDGFYRNIFLRNRFGREIDGYNSAHHTDYLSYSEIHLAPTGREIGTDQERETWEEFVRYLLGLYWIRLDDAATLAYREYLQARHGDIERLNNRYQTTYKEFSSIPLQSAMPAGGMPLSDWDAFIKGWQDPDTGHMYQPAVEHLRVYGPEQMFRDHLRERYDGIETLNTAVNGSWLTFDRVPMPQRDHHFQHFAAEQGMWRREAITVNFLTVADYLIWHGRGFINTLIYCSLAVMLALLVNPLAAYAMSRYRMPSSYKLLLFMLLTMAFPPIVTQIPVFLMLRDLGMLNTFAALVLPGMAHGYSIFLLKGFFDSLPRELYESASIDGASEWTMFWQITMSLSKPILAVIALSAFTAAYTNFMFALLICQDESMWTLMVWLYQLQQRSGQAVLYASLLIAAIPTFLIFFLCQNIILRGIVVPVEK
jgi:multiple sugar transport system permease protein